MKCCKCNTKIHEGDYCDSCEYALDVFFGGASYVSGEAIEDCFPDEISPFWDKLSKAFMDGQVVFDSKHLISIGEFETHYVIK